MVITHACRALNVPRRPVSKSCDCFTVSFHSGIRTARITHLIFSFPCWRPCKSPLQVQFTYLFYAWTLCRYITRGYEGGWTGDRSRTERKRNWAQAICSPFREWQLWRRKLWALDSSKIMVGMFTLINISFTFIYEYILSSFTFIYIYIYTSYTFIIHSFLTVTTMYTTSFRSHTGSR